MISLKTERASSSRSIVGRVVDFVDRPVGRIDNFTVKVGHVVEIAQALVLTAGVAVTVGYIIYTGRPSTSAAEPRAPISQPLPKEDPNIIHVEWTGDPNDSLVRFPLGTSFDILGDWVILPGGQRSEDGLRGKVVKYSEALKKNVVLGSVECKPAPEEAEKTCRVKITSD